MLVADKWRFIVTNMTKPMDKATGWRPMYNGIIDVHGYNLLYLSVDDPSFPDTAREDPLYSKRKGLHFIVPASGTWIDRVIDGTDEPVYLDFLNLDNRVDKLKIRQFLNKYGPPFGGKPEIPTKQSVLFQTVEAMIWLMEWNRDLIIDIKNNPGSRITSSDESSEYYISIDLKTRDLILSSLNLNDFMFLQIADVLSRGLVLTNCETCSAYMTPSRNTRKHCSDACRQKAHRTRPRN
jgi:hypothetical protein